MKKTLKLLFTFLMIITFTSCKSVVVEQIDEVVIEDNTVKDLISKMTLEEKICQTIILDFRKWQTSSDNQEKDFIEINDDIKQILEKYKIGGIILFKENIVDNSQTVNLINNLQQANKVQDETKASIPLFIAVDQEGGMVDRISQSTKLVSNMALAATRNLEYAYNTATIIADELNALGINTNFAPVLDVNSNPNNPVIKVRSFSDDANLVSQMSNEMINAYSDKNIVSCGKHFPGHGDTSTDSHTSLPIVNKNLDELLNFELVSFKNAIENNIDMIMASHIEYSQIENNTYISKYGQEIYLPASLSYEILTNLLRNKLNFNGVIITDALDMNAISNNFTILDASLMSLQAGSDMLLMPCTIRNINELYKLDLIISNIKDAIESNMYSIDKLNTSVERILNLKYKRKILDYYKNDFDINKQIEYANSIVGCNKHQQIAKHISNESITIVKNEDILPLNEDKVKSVLVLNTSNRQTNSLTLSLDNLNKLGYGNNINFEFLNYNQSTSYQKINNLINNYDCVILISEIYDSSEINNNFYITKVIKNTIQTCKENNIKSIVVSNGNPIDVSNYLDANAILITYGTAIYNPLNQSDLSLESAISVILGQIDVNSKLPINIYEIINSTIDTSKLIFKYGYGIELNKLEITNSQ